MPELRRTTIENLELILKLLSITDPPAKIVGSYASDSQYYPSDIDCFHAVGTKDHPFKPDFIAESFANMIRQLIAYGDSHETILLLDFKAGYNPYFLPYLNNGKLKVPPKQILKHPPRGIPKKILNEWKGLNDDDLAEAIRQFYTLRWNADELLQKYKILPDKSRINLADAITHGGIVKVDTAIWLTSLDRLVSVEVFYNIIGYTILPDYKQSLLADIQKFSKDQSKSLKVLKRTYLLLRANNQEPLAEKIEPILQGDVAVLNQVSNDCDLLLQVLEHSNDLTPVDIDRVVLTALSFRRRMAPVLPNELTDKLLDGLTAKNLTQWLERLKLNLKPLIIEGSTKFLNHIKPEILRAIGK